ncbi:prolyl oligopeptidase family serine peptidase [Herbaspirillum sp. LeCh32-8]|uniref:alpha/beta hydrolase family protein n=1 Tax=Herbaspirillum sp. LeCh32-8 TaxID=2821356 RepID=UPI001AE5C6C8|nr:prolyl oligopeptidase family serine peptidase [Herbaspirillum sp. LeCh32-8]MBP0599908.1 prolyl oligopeptidase family serine peptidase [Herbaspirillum sp. LeCh32-8]
MRHSLRFRPLLVAAGGLLVFCSVHLHAQELARDINESVSAIDVTVKDLYGKQETGKVVITQFKPDGLGPFPILILNHGRSPTNRHEPPRFRYTKQARYFVERGFAVFEPTRIGYGQYMTDFDPEESGPCNAREFAPMALAASTETLAVLDYARQQAYVDKSRVLLVGQSVGGYTTVAAAARNPEGVVAAINFAGGSGGDPVHHPAVPCSGARMKDMYAGFGKSTRTPMLWIYTENDLYFGPTYSRAWHEAFVKAGGQAEYHLLPPFAKNGHTLFSSGMEVWAPLVSEFLVKMGFPGQPLKK